ncbi:N-6 DNA methylase [Pyramidobacter sp.]|uniref:N-6 DNA methylase n=1 Tax=Pyramidobacter sp. TaxID=1943581 RepID=UPI003321D2FC
MSIITMDLLKNEKLCKESERVSREIRKYFRSAPEKKATSEVLAAYLLYKVTAAGKYADFPYEKLLTGELDFTPVNSWVIKASLSEYDWKNLYSLASKFSPEAFALSALTCPIEDKMRREEATPRSIISLAQKILNVTDHDAVADLCCGYGTYLTQSSLDEPSADYYGYEINPDNSIIAEIRTRLVSDKIKIVLRNVFDLAGGNPRKRFKKIFSNYPFGMRLRNLGSGERFIEELTTKFPGISKAVSSDWVFNSLICDLLTDDGKAVAIMTNGSTWNGMDMSMRKLFVESGLVECVIALPPRMFSVTSIATSLIVFSKGNTCVRLIDASNICQQGRRYNEFSDEDISAIVNALKEDCEYSKTLTFNELRENDYTLSLERYLSLSGNFEYATPFGDVIKSITRGASLTADQLDAMATNNVTNMRYLELSNIQNGVIDDKLQYLSHIEPSLEKYCLKDGSLLMSKSGYSTKLAVARVQEGQKILANWNLYIIELDEEKVNPYYLKAFFESERGIAVLKSISSGTSISVIGVDMLKKVKIPVPPLEEQNRIAQKYQATMDEIAIYRIKLEKAMSRLHHILDEEREG